MAGSQSILARSKRKTTKHILPQRNGVVFGGYSDSNIREFYNILIIIIIIIFEGLFSWKLSHIQLYYNKARLSGHLCLMTFMVRFVGGCPSLYGY